VKPQLGEAVKEYSSSSANSGMTAMLEKKQNCFDCYRPSVAVAPVLALLMVLVLSTCATKFQVTLNNQQVYNPTTGAGASQITDADLQGCINLALSQQGLNNPTEITVLSCANANISSVDGIIQLRQLRFLDLGGNNISNLTPIRVLSQLAGLNVADNPIIDIAPLLSMSGLSNVNLHGNDDIPCSQLDILRQRLGDNLTEPDTCQN